MPLREVLLPLPKPVGYPALSGRTFLLPALPRGLRLQGLGRVTRHRVCSQASRTTSKPWQERISDGDGKTCGVHAVVLIVVVDDIIVRLGPDKGMAPEVVPHSSTEMTCKVVAAHVVGAAGKGSTVEKRRIKSQVFAADPGHQIHTGLLLERARINPVKVIEDGAHWGQNPKVSRAACVNRAARSPRYIPAKTDVVAQNHDAAEAWIETAAQ